MRKLHVINIEKHNPNYKDRKSIWLKFHFGAMDDLGFTRLCDADKWRFIHFIMLEIKTKKPVPLDIKYLNKQGFDLKSRRLESTIRQLTESELVEIGEGTEWEQSRNSAGTEQEQKPKIVTTKRVKKKSVTQSRVEKRRVEKTIYVRDRPPTKEQILRHIKKHGYTIDGSYFYNKYTADGWLNAKGKPIISWQGTLVTWQNNAEVKSNELSPSHPDSGRVSL